eukprot:TRINITY_DN1593_c0_g1_i1.p2 TRINITY_DN1593_c0_g1~~TRINITY_DN1593_c0_g1_i1.p2  ORF type:complete len:140 (-),score=26.26 TRINITY_DN1593_c0_g1_i1:627-1046(-)
MADDIDENSMPSQEPPMKLEGIDMTGMSDLARAAFEDDEMLLPPPIPCVPLAQSSKTTPAIENLRALLGKKLRVDVNDGRKFFGMGYCFDAQKNVILTACVEERQSKTSAASNEFRADRRSLGMVLIPGKHIARLHVAE